MNETRLISRCIVTKPGSLWLAKFGVFIVSILLSFVVVAEQQPDVQVEYLYGVENLAGARTASSTVNSQDSIQSSHWLRLTFTREIEQPYLLLPQGFGRQFYIYQPPEYVQQAITSGTLGDSEFNNIIAISVELETAKSNSEIYLQAIDGQLPPYVEVFSRTEARAHIELATSLFVGQRVMMLVTLLFALFLWWKLKSSTYIVYAGFVSSTLLLYFTYNDHWYRYFPNLGLSLADNKVLYTLFGTMAYAAAVEFVRSFCQVEQYSERLAKYLTYLRNTLIGLVVLIVLSQGQQQVLSIADLSWLVTALSILFTAFKIWIKGNRLAFYIVIGWTPFVIAAIDMLAVISGWKQGGILNFVYFSSAVLFEILIFQFALADKALSFRKERDHAMSLAYRDALTGVYNRYGLSRTIPGIIEELQQTGQGLVVIIFDIDHFKKINDNFGHDVGDYCLQHIASLIDEHKRDDDLLVRYGGEEFVLALKNTNLHYGQEVCLRIMAATRQANIKVAEQTFSLTLSAGLTQFVAGESFDECFKRADQALYESKSAGRDQLSVN